jgi:hypothetical protein
VVGNIFRSNQVINSATAAPGHTPEFSDFCKNVNTTTNNPTNKHVILDTLVGSLQSLYSIIILTLTLHHSIIEVTFIGYAVGTVFQ